MYTHTLLLLYLFAYTCASASTLLGVAARGPDLREHQAVRAG